MQRGKLWMSAVLAALFLGFLAYTASIEPVAPQSVPVAPANQPAAGLAQPAGFTQSSQCIDCHTQVFAEWRRDQHATAWTDEIFRSFSINYTKDECLSCHAPRPILEVGLASNELQLRAANRADGVDCLTCHVKNGRTHGTLGSGASCGGILEPQLKTSQACYHCHATHNLFKEYLASDYAKRGVSCQDCHMEQVRRPVADGGPVRTTRRHIFHAGGHDPNGLKKALKVELAVKQGKLIATVTNVGAAHGVPGEINNRVMRLEFSVTSSAAEGGEPEEVQAFEAIFRAPPRLARDKVPSTQIMPGEPRVLEYPLDLPHGRVTATLTYKLEVTALNADATVLGEWVLDF